LFPNTAYAKLFNSPLGFIEKVELGLDYFFFTLKTDVFVFIFFSLITALAVKKKNYRNLSLVFGVFIYFLYVLFSAGSANHIGNRFFYLANVITVISFFDQNKNQIYGKIVMLLVFLYMAINPYSPIKITTSFYGNGKYNAFETKIKKALEFYYYDQAYKARILKTGSYLIPNISKDKVSDNKWYKQAVKLNETQGNLRLKGAIGFFGYATPLDVHIIDILGLADAFVARLANCDSIYLRPGHFLRKIPNGYFKTIASNKNFIKNKNLAKYFEKINLITSGDILSKKRIITIYKLNIGKYDYLLESSCDNLQSDFTKKFIKDTKHKK
jgi:arabinofuranosyltransferase